MTLSVTANSRNSRPDDVAHEQQRNQHRDQRDGQRDDREADLLGSFERRLQRRLAFLDVARDVLDHHDGVVHDEAGRDRQRHQGQIVQAVASRYITPNVPTSDKRHGDAGNDRGRERCAGTGTSPCTTRPTVSISSNCTSSTEARMVVVRSVRIVDLDGRQASDALQLRQQRLDAVDDLDDVGARLPLNIDDDGRRCRSSTPPAARSPRHR